MKCLDLFTKLKLPDYAMDYLSHLESKGRQLSTLKRYSYDLEDFFKWKKARDGKELSFEEWRQLDMKEYHLYFDVLKNEKRYSDRTLHRIFTVLRRMAIYYNSINKNATIPEINVKLIDAQGKKLTKYDFVSEEEFKRLERRIQSLEGLSNRQIKKRPLVVERNLSIVYMMYYEGLTLQEVVSLDMKDINFVKGIIKVNSQTSNSREIQIPKWRKNIYYAYYNKIPEAVRPRMHSGECFFCAFHFNLGTYHYVFNESLEPLYPKRISEIGLQRMLQKEVARAGLRKGLAPQHFRNTAILKAIMEGKSNEEIMKQFGFKLELSLKRYVDYANHIRNN